MTGHSPDRKLLGAILAGGRSRRFGSDKASARIDGTPLLDRIIAGLFPQVDLLIVTGRDWPDTLSIPDRPGPGMGPLGGLCAALHYAAEHGFTAVVTMPCDSLPVPPALASLLPSSGGVFDQWPTIGLWPATLSTLLDGHLANTDDRSMHSWIARSGVARLPPPPGLRNFNTPDELERYAST